MCKVELALVVIMWLTLLRWEAYLFFVVDDLQVPVAQTIVTNVTDAHQICVVGVDTEAAPLDEDMATTDWRSSTTPAKSQPLLSSIGRDQVVSPCNGNTFEVLISNTDINVNTITGDTDVNSVKCIQGNDIDAINFDMDKGMHLMLYKDVNATPQVELVAASSSQGELVIEGQPVEVQLFSRERGMYEGLVAKQEELKDHMSDACLFVDTIVKVVKKQIRHLFRQGKLEQRQEAKRIRKIQLKSMNGLRYLPTKNNMKTWKLEIKAESLILNSVKQRRQESTSSKDLLMIILENANSGLLTPGSKKRFIVDNCKSFYFAGYDTSAIAAQWCLMLLASHPEWQIRAHAEVEEVCSGHLPNADSLVKMKLMTMVIQESLRLYPPTMFVAREVIEEVKLGDLRIPKGINIWIPISTMHRDPAIWGEDANEFKPDRFANGISSACNLPNAYIPFGMGSRT
ncbi:hypothetical protein IFM89_027288 [Coptis chinensis]|uniref:Cytochrome P450 n=1 Tax=Coptis chinensis TaxID=261450 RepID=A0A835H8S2_9MAGN|nr:hypothetical protein IFM89_027288 [Coptis chinensis]